MRNKMAADACLSRICLNLMERDHIYCKPCGNLVEIPDASIDIVVTSPPYNLSSKRQRNKKHNVSGYDGFSDCLPQEQYEAEQVALLNACCRVLKCGGSIFYNHKERQNKGVIISPQRWVLRSKCELVQTIIWNRGSTHNIDPVRLYPIHEYIFHLRKPGCRPLFKSQCAKMTTIWSIPFTETRLIPHPAPFPLELPRRCIHLCDPGRNAIILDPYMGSGTTAVAAIRVGIHYVGYEISGQYIALAQHRITQERAEKRMWELSPNNASVRPLRERELFGISFPNRNSESRSGSNAS